jgi:hypothetical protein
MATLPQTPTARFRPTHAVVGNAPAIISIPSDQFVLTQRMFIGVGKPNIASGGTSDVLLAGNGKYCGASGGWVLGASLASSGSGYAEDDTMIVVGGTFSSALILIADNVDPTGALLDFSTNDYGVYSAYPSIPASATNIIGGGSGATFYLATQPPDTYLDITHINDATPGVDLWTCLKGGDNTSSVWFNLSGCPT